VISRVDLSPSPAKSCVEVTLADGTEIILDAGTGIRELGEARATQAKIVRVLLARLHLDHIQGLPCFRPLFDSTNERTVYGPTAPGPNLDRRLARYLSEPLSPIDLHELSARVEFAACPHPGCEIGGRRSRPRSSPIAAGLSATASRRAPPRCATCPTTNRRLVAQWRAPRRDGSRASGSPPAPPF